MFRIEVLNHDEQFELLKIFDFNQEEEAKKFVKKNDDYFLRVVKTGNPRKIIFENF